MHQRRLVGAKFHFAGLHLLHRSGHVKRDRTSLGIWHQALRAEDFSQASDRLHHVRRGNQGVEVSPVLLGDLLDHIFAADVIRTRLLGLFHFFSAGNHQNALGLAEAMRQNYGSAHHLIGVLRINSEPHGDFYGLIELGVFHFLQQWYRVLELIGAALDRLPRFLDVFSCFSHLLSSVSHH